MENNSISVMLAFCMIFLLNMSCKEEKLIVNNKNLAGIWLGGSLELDEGIYRPVSQLMKLNRNGKASFLGQLNNDSTLTYNIYRDTIHFPNVSYPKNAVKLNKYKLSLGRWYPLHYWKIEEIDLGRDSSQISEILKDNVWESEDDQLIFKEDELIVFNHKERVQSKLCWSLQEFESLYFLRRQGNFHECNYPFFNLEYITEIDNEGFKVFRWQETNFKEVHYKKLRAQNVNYMIEDFKFCDPHIYRNNPSNRYYFKYTHFEGGLFQLKRIFDREFIKVDGGNNNGLVRIGFVVNCIGEIGNFDVLELNHEYEETELNPSIPNQLLKILKGTDRWIPGERNGRKIDTYKFLSFKIKNGIIDEIFP